MMFNVRTGLFLAVLIAATSGSSDFLYAQTKTYSTTADFDEGTYINLNATTAQNQLQVNTWTETDASADVDKPVLPYLWVALSGRSTVVRIATSNLPTGNA